MNSCEALETMLDRSGMSKYALSKSLGKSRNHITNTLQNGGDVGASNLAKMAALMGYRLTLTKEGEEPIEVSPRD